MLTTNKTSRSVTKRNSSTVTQSATLANTSMVNKLPTGKPGHTSTIKQHRNKSKKATGMKTATHTGQKWVTKETNNSQIRVRKVFMQRDVNRIGSAGKTINRLTSTNTSMTAVVQMSKSAEGKVPGFNLLTSSKERKRTHHALAPIKQKSHKA